MKSKIISLILLLVFSLVAVVGCGTDGYKKQVKTTIENLSKAKSYEFSGELGLNMEIPNQGKTSPEEEMFSQLFKNVKIKMNGKYNKGDVEESSFDLSVPLNNVEMKVNGYQKGNEMWIRYPMFPTYVHMNANDINKEQKIKDEKASEELVKLLFKLQDKITSSIKDDKFSSSKGTTSGGESVDKIKVKLNKEDLLVIIKTIYDFTESPEFKNSTLNTGEKNSTKDNKKSYEEFVKEFKSNVEVNQLSFTFGISNNLLKEQEVNIDLKFKDKDTKQASNIKLNLLLTYSKINQEVKIEFPDFKKEGVTELEDMMKEGGLLGSPEFGNPNLGDPSLNNVPN